MKALAIAMVLTATPTGPATKLVAIWLDRGSPYMELRPDGSGRIGLNENTWSAEKNTLHVTEKESGNTFELPYTVKGGGKTLELIVNGTTVTLEKSKQKPAAKAPPPPKTPSQIAAGDEADAGTPKKKKGKR